MIANEDITINILANCPVSANSMGGGDRIFIELTKGWIKQGFSCIFLGCEEAVGMCIKNNLDVSTYIISRYSAVRWGVIGAYTARIINSVFRKLPVREGQRTILYSASDFLPDIVPVWRLKKTNKNIKWIVGLYLRMPNPFKGESLFTTRSLFSYLGQQLSIKLMRRYVDLVFVLGIEDFDFLVSNGIGKGKITVISGGVDTNLIDNVKVDEKLYDACFVGRYHPQKGLSDLIESWKIVVEENSNAILVIIGWGDKAIKSTVCKKIKLYNLENNVKFLGFCDGEKKYKVIKSSKIFVFPSNHESWGIVVAEALACGIPVIAYDLPVLKRNFPEGVKFVNLGDYKAFADAIIYLINNSEKYNILRQKGLDLAKKYDWAELADTVGERMKVMF